MHARRTSLLAAAILCTGAALAQSPAPPPDGLDTSWNNGGTLAVALSGYAIGPDATLAVQPDGSVLLAGYCYNNTSTVCMARLLPGGALDYSFGPHGAGIFSFLEFESYPHDSISGVGVEPHALLRQSDGKIVIAASWMLENAQKSTYEWRATITRLLANGTLDPSVASQPVTFDFSHHATRSFSHVSAVAQQADGKLVAVGYTNSADADPPNVDFAVARLRTDLTLDPTFNGTGKVVFGFDRGGEKADQANAVAIQRNGKIVVAGFADAGADGRDIAVARLSPNGTLDTSFGNQGRASFDLGWHMSEVAEAVKIDAAGRIWMAGYRDYNYPDADFVVVRVLADGSALDSGFCDDGWGIAAFDVPGGNQRDVAHDFLLQSDGKIVLVGHAETDAVHAQFAAARLLPDCRYDTTFGSNGKLLGKFASGSALNTANAATFGGSGIVLGGDADGFGVGRLRIDLIFANGFDAF